MPRWLSPLVSVCQACHSFSLVVTFIKCFFFFLPSGTNQPREVFLTEETDSWQCSDTITFRIGFHQLKEARALGQELKVEIHVCNSTGEKMILPQKLTLRYVNIHPEGYRAWFDFGLTVRCLVAIRFSVEGDHIDRRQAQLEHTQLIWHLFKHRHDAYIELDDGPSFDSTAHSCQRNEKQSNSYYSLVEPNSNDAFWPTAESVRMSTVSIDDIFGTVRSLQGSDFHCHDLELPNNENDDPTEEMFCRCSQWCSVSSFYWHNPIFRFLMVQFSNFYLSEQSNHPSSYMCALSALFAQTSQHRVSDASATILQPSLMTSFPLPLVEASSPALPTEFRTILHEATALKEN